MKRSSTGIRADDELVSGGVALGSSEPGPRFDPVGVAMALLGRVSSGQGGKLDLTQQRPPPEVGAGRWVQSCGPENRQGRYLLIGTVGCLWPGKRAQARKPGRDSRSGRHVPTRGTGYHVGSENGLLVDCFWAFAQPAREGESRESRVCAVVGA